MGKLKEPPFTLNQTWQYCLAMWKWIAKVWEKGDSINELKGEWLKRNGFPRHICANCFFCQYITEHCKEDYADCSHCPGKLVSKRFSCKNKSYMYKIKPKKFYQKLAELNKKRKGKK